MINLQRKENESFFDYKLRLITSKLEKEIDLDWVEIKDLLGLDCSADHLRKTAYGIYEYKQHFDEKLQGNLTDEQLTELRIKELEIQKALKKLQAEKNEVNKWLRESSRSELFYDKYLDALQNRTLPTPPNYKIERQVSDTDAVLTLADFHYGKELVVHGLEGEILNKYNVKVFENRMWDLLNKVTDKIEKEQIKHLNVFNLSDSIDGILRMSQLQSLQLGVVDSSIGFADFMVTWLNELSKYVFVDYYSSQGNHNEIRPLGSSKGDFPHENTERFITFHLNRMLSNNPNIKIHPNKNLTYVDVAGTKILATHGQDEKNLENSVKDYIITYNKPVHMLLTGHLHNSHEKTVAKSGLQNIEFVQSPSICGIDEYSVKLKKSANAGAKMMLLERGYGRTTTFDFKLK